MRTPLLQRLALFVAVALLTRAPFLRVPFLDLDEAAALVGARVLLGGGTLYVDFADNRPPLLYAWYALGQALFGDGMPGLRLLAALVVLPLTALAASAFFRHDRRGLVAGLLYLVYGAAFLAHDMHALSPELLMLLPVSWALVLLRDEAGARSGRRTPLAGALVGVGFLLRQQAAFFLPALAFAVWQARRAERASPRRPFSAPAGVLWLGLAFAAPPAATALLFARLGALRELVFWTLVHNLGYAANPISAGEALERAASYLLPFAIVTAPLSWAAWRWTVPRPADGLPGSRHARRLALASLVCAIPAVLLGFRFFPHYFIQLYLPLVLLAAPGTAAALGPPLTRRGRFAAVWPLVLLVGFTVANGVLYFGQRHVYEETRPVFRDVARRLRADPCFGRGPLFVWGFAPQLYAESGLAPASRFVVPQASIAGYVPGNRGARSGQQDTSTLVRADHRELLMSDLVQRRPAFVLDTSPAGLHGWDGHPLAEFPALEAFVRSGYDAIASVDGVWVWRRRGGCRPGGAG